MCLLGLLLWLGGITPCAAQQSLPLGVVVESGNREDLIVSAIQPESPADIMGLLPGDWIVGVNRRLVENAQMYRRALANAGGSTVQLQVLRDSVLTEVWGPLDESSTSGMLPDAELAERHCTTLCLNQDTGIWGDCGCMVAARKICTGCRVGLGLSPTSLAGCPTNDLQPAQIAWDESLP